MVEKILSLLTRSEKIQALWLFALILLMALIETAGVASIMPFIAVLADPDIVTRAGPLSALYERFNFASPRSFTMFLAFAALAILVAANATAALTNWALSYFTSMRTHTISRRLMVHYLRQPYPFFLNRNSADMAKNILSEVNTVVKNILVSLMQIAARGTVCVFIFALLLAVDPRLTAMVAAVLGGSYLAIYLLVQKTLAETGRKRVEATGARFKAIAEAFAGIKDIKVLGREDFYVSRYDTPSRQSALYSILQENIGMLPRYILETVAFAIAILAVLWLIWTKGSLDGVLPLIALYAVAGQRLMPALQQIFSNAAKVRFSTAALDHVAEELSREMPSALPNAEPRLALERGISLRNITFRYAPDRPPVLDGITLDIPARARIGFVGGTGAGKTTLIDILLGLLEPQSGSVETDGVPITAANRRAWQNGIGYVGQHITLFDDSVIQNIACGITPDRIDRAAATRAAQIACLHDFIVAQLPQGYDTPIGENGVRLSGGQRQRIGLARALYHDPPLLILDEATSALDNLTEEEIMKALDLLAGRKTIVMIAHRLTTVQSCDTIYLMERGRIVDSGSYSSLLTSSPAFQALARRAI